MLSEDVIQEFEAVKAVFGECVEEPADGLEASQSFSVNILPDTGGVQSMIFMSMRLTVTLPEKYPNDAAQTEIQSSVGLSAEDCSCLMSEIQARSKSCAEDSCTSLFEIINIAKDFVNSHNTPRDDCIICLESFDIEHPFLKTPCNHAFHCSCLAHWIHDKRVQAAELKGGPTPASNNSEGESKDECSCPVCRTAIPADGGILDQLRDWLEPLAEAHAAASEAEAAAAAAAAAAREGEARARREEERARREEACRAAFEPQPAVVVSVAAGATAKLVRHVMAPFGVVSDCVVQPRAGRAVVWFTAMDAAQRALRAYAAALRLADYDDLRAVGKLPPAAR